MPERPPSLPTGQADSLGPAPPLRHAYGSVNDDATPPSGPSHPGAAPPPRDLTGSVLAQRYRILRRLGVGAMGEVYLGEHLRMGRKDAIKVLRSGMARDPEAMARFTRGARNVARIRHPNVCQVYDFGEAEDGVLFLAMEYVDGGSLGDLLAAHGPIPPPRAARLLAQAAEALHAAHEQGIIHRDLKPDNLMLARTADGEGQVKVVDFDIARGPADEEGAGVTRHGFVVGTPEYMSPEQLTGDPLDRRSDVYSLALVLVRMLTGALPFEGTTAQEIMLQRLTVEPKRLRDVAPPGTVFPDALEVAVASALARRPDDRTAGTRELARQVSASLEAGSAGAATPPESRPPADEAPAAREVPTDPLGPGALAPPPVEGALPATRVAVRPDRAAGAVRRRWAGTGVAAGAALLVGAVIWALVRGPASEPEPSPGGSDPPTTVAQEQDVGRDGPGGEGESEAEGGGPPPSDGLPPPDPEGSDPPSGVPPQRADVPGPVREGDPSPVQPTPAVALGVGASQARTILIRQFRWQDDTEGDPGPAVHRAVRDTTQAVWRLPGLSQADSALAAHILGLSLIALGDSLRGVDWLDQAVQVEPLDRYILVRDAHRRSP